MSRPFPSRSFSPASAIRVNGKIRAREVRVIASDGRQLGVMALHEAINLAKAEGVDLVEVAATANPPVCRIVDFGKFRYEQSKKDKEARKHQHATKLKEIQLSANIDPHDYGVKLQHGIEFLSDEMKVKISLRFRGREMMHKEFGFQVVQKFIQDCAPYGQPDAPPKLIGKGLTVMISPLPRNKRPKQPKVETPPADPGAAREAAATKVPIRAPAKPAEQQRKIESFTNNPFAQLKVEG